MAATGSVPSALARPPAGRRGSRPAGAPRWPRRVLRVRLTGTRVAVGALAAYLALYLSWQLLHWLPGRQQLGQVFLPPADVAALAATWVAARRCRDAPRLRAFWRGMGAAVAAQAVADTLLLRNVLVYRVPPFPTLADPFFLAFYVLLLVALLRVPVARATRPARVRMAIDGATIVVGAGAVVWYFVLGPTAQVGGQGALATAVSLAYPLGDVILLGGLAAVLLRQGPPALRTPLLLVVAGMTASIVADVVYGYGVLHGTYHNGDPIDTLYVVEFLLFALAALAQRPVVAGDPAATPGAWRQLAPRASWLPYLSVATALGILLGVEANKPFFPDASLVVIAIVLMALVATRQHLVQRELLRTQAALRASERAKDEFLALVGHELRTPLTSIRGALGLLDGGVLGALPEEAANMVAVAVLNADRLTRLVNDVLDVERMAAGRLELQLLAVDAGELVRQSLQVVQASADAAGVAVRSEVQPVTVTADPDRVVQVLVNLLGNAVKFSARGDTVAVTVGPDAQGARFDVRDHGRGIPAEQQQCIFERFCQVNASDARERGGTGLGLPIARGLVEQHGGRLWVQSLVGEGSTFAFTLPAVAADGAPAGPDPAEPCGCAEVPPRERPPGHRPQTVTHRGRAGSGVT